MTETKEQVFEYFVDQTIRIATPLGMSMARSTQFRKDALEMYAGATDETPEQAKCPYCHDEEGQPCDPDGYYAGNLFMGTDGYIEYPDEIKYCQYCGRELIGGDAHH